MAKTRKKCSSAIRWRASRTFPRRPCKKIDAEIRRLVEAGYQEAQQILTDKRADLETLAKGLLEFETLTGDEIKDLLLGKRPNRESVIEPSDAAKLDGADRRRRPQPAAPRARPDGAAAAGS